MKKKKNNNKVPARDEAVVSLFLSLLFLRGNGNNGLSSIQEQTRLFAKVHEGNDSGTRETC